MSQQVRSKKQSYLDPANRTTRTTFHPQVKVKGAWCYLVDESSPSKLVEAPDAMTAVEMAIKYFRVGEAADQ